MNGKQKIKDSFITWSVWCLARFIASTIRVKAIGEEILTNLKVDEGESLILVGWHGSTFIPITRFRNRGYWAMISTSRDGDRQNQLFHRFGFRTVRGSTSARGAIEAVITMRKELKKGGVLAHTVDGPRGPRGVVHPGAIYLAQKAGCPLVPVGVAASPCVNLSTWDKYIVPLLFSRGVMVYGQAVRVPSDLDDDGRALYAEYLGERIHCVQKLAEECAATGKVPDMTKVEVPSPPIPVSSGK
jgi:lysophospholipid acyltransferase (LPLAT)-like uncharacterized protein